MSAGTAGRSPSVAELAEEIRAGNRATLSRAITVLESRRADHADIARALVQELGTGPNSTVRLGISGTPGVGKSTFIESFGCWLIKQGHRVGVLAVDPSSSRTGGSVLGDKTRMPRLSSQQAAYVRPSPTAGTLGGVTRATAQTIPVLEAAGYDVILVETVGVGQSETAVGGMVDTFLLLGLARSGDQLQGIKKGVLEIANVLAVNKADGDRVVEAKAAAKELMAAIRLVYPRGSAYTPTVLTTSGLEGQGLGDVWEAVHRHRESYGPGGIATLRAEQQWELAQVLLRSAIEERVRRSESVRDLAEELRGKVLAGQLAAVNAADAMLRAYDER